MVQFILGILLGGTVGFIICAICSMAGTDDRTEICVNKESRDKNVGNK